MRGNSRDCPLKSPNLGIFGTVLNSPRVQNLLQKSPVSKEIIIIILYSNLFRADTGPAPTFRAIPGRRGCRPPYSICDKFVFGRMQYAPTNPTSHLTHPFYKFQFIFQFLAKFFNPCFIISSNCKFFVSTFSNAFSISRFV